MIDVFDIVKKYLTDNKKKYDGLCQGSCSCLTEEIGECNALDADCQAGHKTKLDSDGFWVLEPGPRKGGAV